MWSGLVEGRGVALFDKPGPLSTVQARGRRVCRCVRQEGGAQWSPTLCFVCLSVPREHLSSGQWFGTKPGPDSGAQPANLAGGRGGSLARVGVSENVQNPQLFASQ